VPDANVEPETTEKGKAHSGASRRAPYRNKCNQKLAREDPRVNRSFCPPRGGSRRRRRPSLAASDGSRVRIPTSQLLFFASRRTPSADKSIVPCFMQIARRVWRGECRHATGPGRARIVLCFTRALSTEISVLYRLVQHDARPPRSARWGVLVSAAAREGGRMPENRPNFSVFRTFKAINRRQTIVLCFTLGDQGPLLLFFASRISRRPPRKRRSQYCSLLHARAFVLCFTDYCS